MAAIRTYISRNKGKIVGQKPALKLREVWIIRVRFQLNTATRHLALFKLAIGFKPRG